MIPPVLQNIQNMLNVQGTMMNTNLIIKSW